LKIRAAATAISALSLALGLSMGGCGSKATQSSSVAPNIPPTSATVPALAWKNNGNPLVPFCSSTNPINCVSSFTIRDVTTGATVTVAITASSYGPVSPGDSYEIRVDGFDGDGNPISSPYAAFPAAP